MFLTHWLRPRPAKPPRTSGRARLAVERMEDRLVPAGIPALHSNPGAPAAIYLDFDGHFEASWGAWSNITTPVFNQDGDATSFSDTEIATIQAVWARAAEDYAPFNIDVTTVEPAVLAPGVPSANANGKALRVSIGGNSSWMGASWGGYGYYNSFTNTTSNVCYVFDTNNTAGVRWLGDTVSHEAGHSFGLYHQSTFDANGAEQSEYSLGDLSTWSPIMGSSYTGLSIWYNGPTTSATSLQDDLAMLASATNGFGYRADDRGNTAATAVPLAATGPGTWAGAGIVGTNTDVDYFSFTVATADTYRITAGGPGTDANLDAVVELRTASGQLVEAADPGTSFDATVVRPLTPGAYTVAVRSNGMYGRIGSYTLGIDAPPAGVTVATATAPTTGEAGRTTTLTVALQTAPIGDVVIPISSSNPTEGAVSVAILTFTPANWNVPQTVTVTGVADGVADGDAVYTIVVGPATSTDPEYAGIDPADVTVTNLDVDGAGFIYYADGTNQTIGRARIDGSFPEVLIDIRTAFGAATTYAPSRVAADVTGGKLYWIDSATHWVYRANLDGSTPERVLDVGVWTANGLSSPSGFALDPAAGKMYWSDGTAQAKWIRRADLDGTGVELLVTAANAPTGVALDPAGGKMYWTEFATGGVVTVRRASLDGTGLEVLWTSGSTSTSGGVALDVAGGKMYWPDSAQRVIRRANLDGSGVEVVVDFGAVAPTSNIGGFALDAAAGKMYWRDAVAKISYRANLDGTAMAGFLEGATPSGIAVVRLAPAISVTGRAGLVTTEGGTGASFRVVLTGKPAANVVIPVSSNDATEGTVTATGLTFTPANWNVPQSVTITPVDDSTVDGTVTYAIVLGIASSTDATYNGSNPADATVTSIDNDVTKFFVADDGSTDRTYRYGAPVNGLASSALTSKNSAPRGAASTAAGDKVWVLDANKTVYVYSATGTLLGSWTAGGLDRSAVVEGITVWGSDVWIVDAKLDRVYQYAGAATRMSGSQNATSSFALDADNNSPKDLVTDGTHLWVVDDQVLDRVHKYKLDGTYVTAWAIDPTNASPTGITLDPTNPRHLWIVDNGTDRVYQYNNAVTRSSGTMTASASYALAAGNTNPQAIADPPPGWGSESDTPAPTAPLSVTPVAGPAAPALLGRSAPEAVPVPGRLAWLGPDAVPMTPAPVEATTRRATPSTPPDHAPVTLPSESGPSPLRDWFLLTGDDSELARWWGIALDLAQI